jgi:YVTN family beta-propeller protein
MSRRILVACLSLFSLPLLASQLPHAVAGGFELPNGWRITPLGKPIPTEDLLLNMVVAPDGKSVIATHGGYNQHGLVVIDTETETAVQRIPLKSAWLGLAWHPGGKKLFVSGGNANGRVPSAAPIYVFDYDNGRLSAQPNGQFQETVDRSQIYWSGLAHHPNKPILYAANRGGSNLAGHVVLFDSSTGKLRKRIQVENTPYDLVLSPDGRRLYVSNWGSESVSVIDTELERVVARFAVDSNPNDMELHKDGRLFVSCANDNSVVVVDTASGRPIERISVSLSPGAPAGTTPNALTLDAAAHLLFVANADNNAVAVVNVSERGESDIEGFLPAGWYPSSLAWIGGKSPKLYVGNSKGLGSYSNVQGPTSPLAAGNQQRLGHVAALQKGSVNIVPLSGFRAQIKAWTKQVYENTPYRAELLQRARPAKEPTVVPDQVGVGSKIKHVIYIIKENRTYDQVLGDMPKGNGDARLAIFGQEVTPNHHAIAAEWVLLDNLYCDGEVSVDGHSWSNSAYATDFNEKMWPARYGGHSQNSISNAYRPKLNLWDLAARKGLTYRSYGEYATRASDGTRMDAVPGVGGLLGHIAPGFKMPGMRDTDNVREFIREFDEYEKNYASDDPDKRLPNYIVMSLPENHTRGTRPGELTPKAMVANNDHAVGLLVERVTHSRYWPETAVFIIEDDAQNGSDHVDARRTVGLVISPYTKRGVVDSTLYTTSSMLRTIELLLGLPPMSQYDAAATPMYASFNDKPDLAPYRHTAPKIDVNEKNQQTAWGARESMEMDFDEVDRAPMFALNEVIWKSVRGPDSEMPVPVHRYWFAGRR